MVVSCFPLWADGASLFPNEKCIMKMSKKNPKYWKFIFGFEDDLSLLETFNHSVGVRG